jgi:hypothetical protein
VAKIKSNRVPTPAIKFEKGMEVRISMSAHDFRGRLGRVYEVCESSFGDTTIKVAFRTGQRFFVVRYSMCDVTLKIAYEGNTLIKDQAEIAADPVLNTDSVGILSGGKLEIVRVKPY